MTWKPAVLIPLALALGAAAHAPKAPPAKAAAAKPAAATASEKPAAGPFDATNPQGLMGLLDAAGAKVQTTNRDGDAVFTAVTSPAANFSMQFAGCDEHGRACKAVLMDSAVDGGAVRLDQINAFNQSSLACRLYQDKASGQPHVLFSSAVLRSMTHDDAVTLLGLWQGCIADAREFARDPVKYLANAA